MEKRVDLTQILANNFEEEQKKLEKPSLVSKLIKAGIATIGAGIIYTNCARVETYSPEMSQYINYILPHEGGIKTKVYDPIPKDKKWEPTVGVGHYMLGAGKATFEKTLPNISYQDVLTGKRELTKLEALQLFQADIQEKINQARKDFPKYDTFSTDAKKAIIDGYFRGEMYGSPKTKRLINEGEWTKAASEYLNNNEFKNAKKLGKAGIRKRMAKNAVLIANEAKK